MKILQNSKTLHDMLVRLADKYVSELSDSEILSRCPADYDAPVTDEHRTYLWDSFYEEVEQYLEPLDIYEMYQTYIVNGRSMKPAYLSEESIEKLLSDIGGTSSFMLLKKK